MDVDGYPNETRPLKSIAAIGIHISLVAYPPMSPRLVAPNSFVLPAHKLDVSHAPKQGLCPYGDNST